MVAFVLDKLEIREGNRVLEIGAGCGYAAAVASRLCGETGKLWAVEVVPELVETLRQNLRHARRDISIVSGDGSGGLPDQRPFDRIFLSAGVSKSTFRPEILLDQLAAGGILIYPEAQGSLWKITRAATVNVIQEFSGVSFVPLVGEYA
jgi:protein-L-isoaspartate(D-aspartate) O-methyltransferase